MDFNFKFPSDEMKALAEEVAKSNSPDKPMTVSSEIWKTLERDITNLHLDLFELSTSDSKDLSKDCEGTSNENQTTAKEESTASQETITPLEVASIPANGLAPLLQFRQIHILKLTGMMHSYQPTIWKVVWLQPFLKTLHLEMCLSPLFNLDSDHPIQAIDDTWAFSGADRQDLGSNGYVGHHAEGVLHDEFGEGEYLDYHAILAAHEEVKNDLPFNNRIFLPIEKLSLMNFAIDGTALNYWFDPQRFKELEFKEGCIDAGLYLNDSLRHVAITAPKPIPAPQMVRVVKPGELKIIELKKGKVVSRKDALTGKEELFAAQSQPGLKAKVSKMVLQGFGGGKKEEKEESKEESARLIQEINEHFKKHGFLPKDKENKDGEKDGRDVAKNIADTFSAMEIRKAKDGKKPMRD